MSVSESREFAGVWQKRFAFFDAYGLPGGTPEAKAAFRALTFGQRVRLTSNIWAFVFGPFYFYAKGMWRKATTLLVALVGIGALLAALPVGDSVARAIGFGLAAGVMTTANFAYYLHRNGSRSWNPLEGFRPGR